MKGMRIANKTAWRSLLEPRAHPTKMVLRQIIYTEVSNSGATREAGRCVQTGKMNEACVDDQNEI